MPEQRRNFVNGEIYHIVLRRMGNEALFEDTDDYYRGIFCIYEFNTAKPVKIREQRRVRAKFKEALRKTLKINTGQTCVNLKKVKIPKALVWRDKRKKLVEVLAFCLMPNHIHLLVKQLREKGISKFIQKIGSGYAGYFKKKHQIKLKGHFFQDRFGAVHIKTDDQLRVVFTYIHTNPVALVEPNWKQKGVGNPEKVIKFLEKEYRWSSLRDYLDQKNFPSVIKKNFILKVMGGKKGCKEWVENWVKYKGESRKLKLMEKFANLNLEKFTQV